MQIEVTLAGVTIFLLGLAVIALSFAMISVTRRQTKLETQFVEAEELLIDLTKMWGPKEHQAFSQQLAKATSDADAASKQVEDLARYTGTLAKTMQAIITGDMATLEDSAALTEVVEGTNS